MEFRILGPFEAFEGDLPVALGARKPRALCAILLLHANEVVSTDRLIDELWGDRAPASARHLLQVYVSQLRRALTNGLGGDKQFVVTRAPGYVIEVEQDEFDLYRFEQLTEEAERAMRMNDAVTASVKLREALGLWRGPPLAEFAYEPFAQREVARLEEFRLHAIEERIESDLSVGRHDAVVGELERLVAEHPLRERLRRQQMLALYRSGRQADALAAYQAARRALVDELGIDPAPALQRLEKAILTHDPSLEPPVHPGPLTQTSTSAETRPPAPALPGGTVTFLFTDIEGSTALVKELRDRYAEVLAEHQRVLRDAFEAAGGHEVDTQGDSFFVVFRRAKDAVAAAVAAQRAIRSHPWPDGVSVRVRMGIHTGEPTASSSRYVGLGVHRAARISAAAHGGQILASRTTCELVEDDLPAGVTLLDLGEAKLKDLDRPERLFQVVPEGLEGEFPPLRTEGGPSMPGASLAIGRLRVPRRLAFVLAAVVAAVGALALALVLVQAGGSDGVAMIPANSVGRIDAKTSRIVGATQVGSGPTLIAAGEEAIWVANIDDRTLSKIDPQTGEEVRRISTGGAPTGLAAGAGAVWIAHGFDGTLARVDPGLTEIIETVRIGSGAYDVSTGLGAVWVTNGLDGTVIRIDPTTNGVDATFDIGGEPGSVAVGGGAVWVADRRAIVRIDPNGGDPKRIALRFDATDLVVGEGAVWVSSRLGDSVTKIDLRTVTATSSASVGDDPVGIAAGAGAVWVANALDGSLSRIDPATSAVVTTVVSGVVYGVAVDGAVVWVTAPAP